LYHDDSVKDPPKMSKRNALWGRRALHVSLTYDTHERDDLAASLPKIRRSTKPRAVAWNHGRSGESEAVIPSADRSEDHLPYQGERETGTKHMREKSDIFSPSDSSWLLPYHWN
jgi:hypothetical protein